MSSKGNNPFDDPLPQSSNNPFASIPQDLRSDRSDHSERQPSLRSEKSDKSEQRGNNPFDSLSEKDLSSSSAPTYNNPFADLSERSEGSERLPYADNSFEAPSGEGTADETVIVAKAKAEPPSLASENFSVVDWINHKFPTGISLICILLLSFHSFV